MKLYGTLGRVPVPYPGTIPSLGKSACCTWLWGIVAKINPGGLQPIIREKGGTEVDSSSPELPLCSFFDKGKTLPGEWSLRSDRLAENSVPDGPKRYLGSASNKYWLERIKKLENSRTSTHTRPLAGMGGGAASPPASLSNVPKQAALVADAKMQLLGQLFGIPELQPAPSKPESKFYVTLGVMKSRVRVRAESPGARRARQYHGMAFSRRSQRLVNDRTGEIVSLTRYLTLEPAEQPFYKPLGVFRTGTRSEIFEFSEKSASRLCEASHEATAELKQQGIKPGFMLTLTYPGDWRSVAPDGRAVKRHLDKMERRLKRYFKRLDMDFSALWFLEFQKRGAPHFHLIMWGAHLTLSDSQLRAAQTDLRIAWAEVVGHADPIHHERHKRRGVGFERMRKGHLGYAAKYAKKMQQKAVPDEFANVGRFWGFWKHKTAVPDVLELQLTLEQLDSLGEALAMAVLPVSLPFANRLLGTLLPRVEKDWNGNTTKIGEVNGSLTVFGEAAVKAVWDWLGAGFRYERKHTAAVAGSG